MATGTQASPFAYLVMQTITRELVSGNETGSKELRNKPYLSVMDQTCVGYASVGVQMVYRESVVTPLLKTALSEALSELPWFGGRLVLREDGRTFDVACTNGGAQLVVASTSTTFGQLAEPLLARSYAAPSSLDPWQEYALPRDPDTIVKRQLPLACVMLLHLSGGGGLLAVTAYHGIADFESLQTFVAHLSAAYNAALARRRAGGVDGSGSVLAGTATGQGAARTQPPADRRDAFFDPDTVVALANSGPLPAGVPAREGMVVIPKWIPSYVTFKAIYEIFFKGGGLEVRNLHVSQQRLAALKQQATLELAEEKAREGGGGELRDVQWVSTKDALAARLAQVLHSLPLRRSHPMAFLVAANMRRRTEPPLPACQLGNFIIATRVDGTRPADTSLGRLAGLQRLHLIRYITPQYLSATRQMEMLVRQHNVGGLTYQPVIDPDPYKCLLEPRGPYLMSNWDIQHDMWQFGPEPPFAWLPLYPAGPNVIVLYPAPKAEGGMYLCIGLHNNAWRQMDKMTGGDLAAWL